MRSLPITAAPTTLPVASKAGRLATQSRRAALLAARRVALPVALALAIGLVWEFGLRFSHVSTMLIVPPSAVWTVLTASYPILAAQALPTIQATVVGFVLAAVSGIGLGMVLVLSRRVQQALYPHLLLFQLIPKVALAPLFIVWLGVGPSSRLMFAVFMAFFPVVVSTLTGLLSVDRTALRLCESVTASGWQTFWYVRVPYALPHIFAGLKVSMTMAMVGVIVGEFVMAQEGLGYIIMFATSSADTALVFACIALLCAIGLVLYAAVALIEKLVDHRLGVSITTGEF